MACFFVRLWLIIFWTEPIYAALEASLLLLGIRDFAC